MFVDETLATERAHAALLEREDLAEDLAPAAPLDVLVHLLEEEVGAMPFSLSRVGPGDYEVRLLSGDVGFGETAAAAVQRLLVDLGAAAARR